MLEGPSAMENARFGTAITAVPDLNLDGFSDVVVGAPLEGNGQGAIYIYYGDRKNIRKQSSQVEPNFTESSTHIKYISKCPNSEYSYTFRKLLERN